MNPQQIHEHELNEGFQMNPQQIREHELNEGFQHLFYDKKAKSLLSTIKQQWNSLNDNNFIFEIIIPKHGATYSAILFLQLFKF
jgi:hypothetical protein